MIRGRQMKLTLQGPFLFLTCGGDSSQTKGETVRAREKKRGTKQNNWSEWNKESSGRRGGTFLLHHGFLF